jgi:tRNA(Ser,Leu) C12 N-acetylase TAN1
VIDTPSTERAIGDLVFRLAEERGRPVKVTFDDPDVILAVEIIGASAGLALITRERRKFPFVKIG